MATKNWISVVKGTPEEPEYIDIPCPAIGSGGMTISTIIDGNNNTNGRFIGSVIGGDKLKIDISFSHLTNRQFKDFLSLFNREHRGNFYNTFYVYDPRGNENSEEGVYKELDMYITDRTGRPLQLTLKNGEYAPSGWADVSASLVEL